MAVVQAPIDGPYNAGSGESHSVGDVAERVGEMTGRRKPLHVTGPVRPNEILDVVADVSRAEAALGWRPRISFDEGLQETITSMAHGMARA